VGPDKLVANREAESGSGRLRREEGVKDSTDHAGTDPISRVAEFDANSIGSRYGFHHGCYTHPKSSTLFGHGFDRILNDIVKNLRHLALVDWKHRAILRIAGNDMDAFLLRAF